MRSSFPVTFRLINFNALSGMIFPSLLMWTKRHSPWKSFKGSDPEQPDKRSKLKKMRLATILAFMGISRIRRVGTRENAKRNQNERMERPWLEAGVCPKVLAFFSGSMHWLL